MTAKKLKKKTLRPLELRTVNSSDFSFDDKNLTVSGYVNYTGTKSEPIPNFGDVPESDNILDDPEYFIEIMKPGVFSDALKQADFVDFLFEHNPMKYLSSTHENTLKLNEDDKGLHMDATITPTSWGKDAYTLIKSGAVAGMSFGFRVLSDSWDLSGEVPVRTVSQIQLYEVSAVRFPAYDGSDISARKRYRALNKKLEKRGFTLHHVRIAKRSVKKHMSKPFEENRASATSNTPSQAPSSVDINNVATSLDRVNTTLQSLAEVEDNVYKTLLSIDQDNNRAKSVAHATEKRAEQGSTDDNSKSEQASKPSKSDTEKSKPATKGKDDGEQGKTPSADQKPAKEEPQKTEKPSAKDEKRSKQADKMLAELSNIEK